MYNPFRSQRARDKAQVLSAHLIYLGNRYKNNVLVYITCQQRLAWERPYCTYEYRCPYQLSRQS